MDAAEKRLPQEGRVTMEFEGEPVDLCITTVPSVFGENVIIRIVDERTQELGLKGLGLDGAELASLREALRNPRGLVLIAGPEGSGKSTTLYAGLEELNRPGVKIYTVEDPVEKVVSGVVQAAGPAAPRAGLRLDAPPVGPLRPGRHHGRRVLRRRGDGARRGGSRTGGASDPVDAPRGGMLRRASARLGELGLPVGPGLLESGLRSCPALGAALVPALQAAGLPRPRSR